MFSHEAVDMADAFLLKNLVHSNENAALLYVTELIIDRCSEELHRRAQIHVGIDQWRNVIPELPHLMVKQAIVVLEIIFIEKLFQLIRRRVDLHGLNGDNQMLIVSEVLAEEVENHVAPTSDKRRVHRHLPKKILTTGIDNRERA